MQSLSTLTDDKLVEAYVQGNNRAFDALLKRHQTRVFNYIYSIVKNRDVADDIFQDTFVKTIMTIKQGRYAEHGKFSSWLMRVAHNLIIDYYRQEKSENLLSTDAGEVDILNRHDLSEANIEDQMVTLQITEDVRRIIKALPKEQRQVLEMRYYQDMSFKEIAQHTQVSINTALGRMRYALMNIRRIVADNKIVLTS
ncbi:MAG: sigma-70 family RNA polymerase sigma factor [Bacteroidales bacterium]|nr:sigma-70 family RNA polymerase sigma factor [Bacteroidales bacterium]